MRQFLVGIAFIVAVLTSSEASAQSSVRPCFYNASGVCVFISAGNPLPVSASVSASITGFPGASPTTGTPISVTTGGVTGTLPSGAVVVASNVGTTNIAYCKLGASATTSDQPIAPNGGWFAFTVGSATQLTCITSTSTTTVNMVGGSGIATGTGGGGGGSGGAVTLASGAVSSGAYSSGAFASGSFASGAFASGSFASGSHASGSFASGAFASGSVASGAMVDLGAQADSVCSTATGTCSLIALMKYNNNTAPVLGAGSAIVGKVGIDQTTSAVTNGVMNAGSAYETIAASQTGQAMGATGGTGDYLSHCVIYPQTTTPGVVTVFDSTSSAANNVIAFPGGASSVASLAPIPIPVGAISVNGAWKVTTGANVIVTCHGKFT